MLKLAYVDIRAEMNGTMYMSHLRALLDNRFISLDDFRYRD